MIILLLNRVYTCYTVRMINLYGSSRERPFLICFSIVYLINEGLIDYVYLYASQWVLFQPLLLNGCLKGKYLRGAFWRSQSLKWPDFPCPWSHALVLGLGLGIYSGYTQLIHVNSISTTSIYTPMVKRASNLRALYPLNILVVLFSYSVCSSEPGFFNIFLVA